MKSYGVHMLLSLLAAAGCTAAYDHWWIRPQLRIGVVDVATVYHEKEEQFRRLAAAGAADRGADRAMLMARRFAQRLPAALDELPGECGCLVYDKSVLMGDVPSALDLTERLREKVK
ncbi:hypothetical protein [Rugamonas aquatica]|uniref:Uncharacterized protein n=1 Tax=Rugamonas aquatica TaxID=2743357 RepID=A0A6A7N675_9BURK|nr:hypothetical protein [Rugamonas aquatica]MQA40593.1 hypothetical protein [Rugamonas aquatica]